jgi:pimeloyl-ACP methyl ester carboxylesterase
MDEGEPQFLELGGERAVPRRIAYRLSPGDPGKVKLLWLPGFLSDMASTKALAVADWARAHRHAMLRFDYSGHGLSGGDLREATIGDWLEEAALMFDALGNGPRIVIGSSMGGWLALLLARRLKEQERSGELAGLVLIAPAWDMTEMLMWRKFSERRREEVESKGVTPVPSAYGEAYPVTKRLIEEGRSHSIEGRSFDPGCPVRILQGYRDADVPWRHALALIDLLAGEDVELTLIKSGDHRLSEPQDLLRLTAAIAALAGND